MNITVNPQAPYDMERVLWKLGADPQYELEIEQKQLTFPVRVKVGQEERSWKKAVVTLTSVGKVDEPQINIMVKGDPLNENEREWLIDHMTQRFQWKADVLLRFYEEVQKFPQIDKLVQEYRGLPLVLDEGIYEGLIKTIVHQQLNLKFAQQLVVTLSQDYGDQLQIEGRDYFFFPTATQLAQVPVEELRTKKFSQRKAEYITGVAQKVSTGELDLDKLSSLENEKYIEMLSKERGVGVWTVECILLFGLARPNLFPAGDIGIRNAIQRIEGLEVRQTIEECREWAKPFEQWGSYLSIYLWESLGNNRLKVEKDAQKGRSLREAK